MKIGNREFDIKNRTYVMGILNITPDSFSDGGKWNIRDQALKRVEEMIAEGMDILDIGGESTRPGYTPLGEEEEIERVVPVIEAVKANFHIPVSLDTYKSKVAHEGICAGIDLVNDIWGLKYDSMTGGGSMMGNGITGGDTRNRDMTDGEMRSISTMGRVIAESGLPCCLMHNRKEPNYRDFMQDVAADLADTVYLAKKAGIAEDKIILDPGVGFGKTYEQNLEIINHLESLQIFGLPILLGTSRKSVIGLTLDLPVQERLEGTLATTVIGVMKRCAFVRVHDIKANVRAIRMTEAILQR